MLSTKDVSYWYDNQEGALYKDVNLDFESGKLYGIIGSSGSGKTTLLTMLAGLDRPSKGEILYNDTSLKQISLSKYRNQYVSIVFQSYNLLPYMSAVDNVVTAMKITHSESENMRDKAMRTLAKVGIDETLAVKNVLKLSGGQQQRVAIVRAMCCDAPIVVADEPTGNLDETNTQEIITLFQELAHEQDKCVILVTHEKEVSKRCDIQYELSKKKFTQV
ncbi:multidrug ABC transporter ATP-binding protein [Companilactobacillus sp. RD055328]|uniref:ABC transporter ATP-binding protein n=1 Tax=Companilactobacillus sp. RD055328 TaxID=2916634 RepID=UPI001FC8E821|nr:ABC transporter ATP-binding protein [Companilactobacillus sp. RD055328]GKQ43181.1 multidrug ABC transporter ATP-binding protein [Companilactobacillus sp. RD055328]